MAAQSFTTAVITGTRGGLGSAISRRLLTLNPNLTLAALSRDGSGVAGLDPAHKNRVIPIQCDITNEESVRAAAEQVKAHLDDCQLVWNAAGLLHSEELGVKPEKSIRNIDPHMMHQQFAVNAYGVAYLGKHFMPLMKQTKSRDPKVFASISARVGSIEDNQAGGWITYRAAKSAQNQILQCLALEHARNNIVCAALQPGTVISNLSKPFIADPPVLHLKSYFCIFSLKKCIFVCRSHM